MSWKSLIARAEKILGGPAPAVDISLLGKTESSILIESVTRLASISDHKIIPVLYTQIPGIPRRFFSISKWASFFARKSYAPRFPQTMLIPLVGQCIHNRSDVTSLELHRKLGGIYAIINLAVALHRSVTDPSNPPAGCLNISKWVENTENANKIAVLAGDVLLALASVDLASYKIPKVVEMISRAIADTVRAEFTDVSSNSSELTHPSKLWQQHITLRHGALLGECCAATALLNCPTADETLIQTARNFGNKWGILARILSEVEFVRDVEERFPKRPKTFTAVGFTESGLPEPTLADVYRYAMGDKLETDDMYRPVAHKIKSELQEACKALVSCRKDSSDVQSLAQDCVDMITNETVNI